MWHEFRTETVIYRPISEVFEFFSNAENLEAITPSSLQFRIVSPTPIEMDTGTIIDYRLRLNGVKVKWKTRIDVWSPPHEFVDRQLKGPYRDWIHRHHFRDLGDGTTAMKDHVRYRLPVFPLGEVALPVVAFQVRMIFRHRERKIREFLGEQGEDSHEEQRAG